MILHAKYETVVGFTRFIHLRAHRGESLTVGDLKLYLKQISSKEK